MDYEQFIISAIFDDSKTVTYKELHLALNISNKQAKDLLLKVYEKNKDKLDAVHYVVVTSNGVLNVALMSHEDFENLDSSSIHSSFIHSIGKKKNSSSMDIEGNQEGFAKIWSDLHQTPTEWAPFDLVEKPKWISSNGGPFIPPALTVEAPKSPSSRSSVSGTSSFCSPHSQQSRSGLKSSSTENSQHSSTLSNSENNNNNNNNNTKNASQEGGIGYNSQNHSQTLTSSQQSSQASPPPSSPLPSSPSSSQSYVRPSSIPRPGRENTGVKKRLPANQPTLSFGPRKQGTPTVQSLLNFPSRSSGSFNTNSNKSGNSYSSSNSSSSSSSSSLLSSSPSSPSPSPSPSSSPLSSPSHTSSSPSHTSSSHQPTLTSSRFSLSSSHPPSIQKKKNRMTLEDDEDDEEDDDEGMKKEEEDSVEGNKGKGGKGGIEDRQKQVEELFDMKKEKKIFGSHNEKYKLQRVEGMYDDDNDNGNEEKDDDDEDFHLATHKQNKQSTKDKTLEEKFSEAIQAAKEAVDSRANVKGNPKRIGNQPTMAAFFQKKT